MSHSRSKAQPTRVASIATHSARALRPSNCTSVFQTGQARPNMNIISTADLQELKTKEPNLVIVNTLPREEFDNTNIPGAISIPVDVPDFDDRVALAAGAK